MAKLNNLKFNSLVINSVEYEHQVKKLFLWGKEKRSQFIYHNNLGRYNDDLKSEIFDDFKLEDDFKSKSSNYLSRE